MSALGRFARSAGWLAGAAVALMASGAVAAEPAPQCKFKGDASACFPYGCVPVNAQAQPDTSDPDMIAPGAPGRCGPCTDDAHCGGAKCFKTGPEKGTCAAFDGSPAPVALWPRFGLVVAEVATNLADRAGPKPIVSVGYLFQGALSGTAPIARAEGGFITPDTPSWYFDLSVSAAFAGPSQNLFATLGLTYYKPTLPIPLSTISFGALYQRQGEAVWRVWDTDVNQDRLGPSVTLGFLQNIYLRGAYVFGLSGPDRHGAVILSLLYMRDLFNDLVSDRFRKYLPEALSQIRP